MSLVTLSSADALCPLDGRYIDQACQLHPYFSERALVKARAEVEIEYLLALAADPRISEFSELAPKDKQQLLLLVKNFTDDDMQRIKHHEAEIRHDVKAVEYWLREKITGQQLPVPLSFIHFALTSEDVTNLAYGLLINGALSQCLHLKLLQVRGEIPRSEPYQAAQAILGMTHGQPATPTDTQKELSVYVERLDSVIDRAREFRMDGKFGGAVGNYSAHYAAYPEIEWPQFGSEFVKSLGLNPLYHTTQINPHDDIARLSHLMIEANTILLDLCDDMWLYISRGILCERAKEVEVGSSTMPNKVNPIDWENAKGNLGISNALFSHFAEKLPRSFMQRDLSDSTVQRWLGCAFGAQLMALNGIRRGLAKIRVNKERAHDELRQHPEVHAEAIQTVMRRYGYDDAYEQLKELTRGKAVTVEMLTDFVRGLYQVPDEAKQRLINLLTE